MSEDTDDHRSPNPDAGDQLDEFVQELTRHQDELLLVIRGLCGDPDVAADIRQAVNIVLWKKRAKFTLGTNFRAWAYRIAQLEVKAYFRKAKREGMLVFRPELLDTLAEELSEVSPQLEDRKRALRVCPKKLTPKDTQLVQKRYWHRGTLQSLASVTGRSVGTLKARLHQLRTSLRRCVNNQLTKQAEA